MSPILIERIQTIIVDLPTIRPHKLAMHTMQQQTLVILRLRCSDGVEGIGEATTIGGLAYDLDFGQRSQYRGDQATEQRRIIGDGHDLFDVELPAQRFGKLLDRASHLRVGAGHGHALQGPADAELFALADH